MARFDRLARAGRRLALLLALALAGGACKGQSASSLATSDGAAEVALSPGGPVLQAAENERRTESSAAVTGPLDQAGPRVTIPEGRLTAGSVPGDKGRDPTLEPTLLDVPMGGYAIDRRPHPGDARKPPMTGVTRSRATEICQQAGGRLCTELEWERACKGPHNLPFSVGDTWNPACEEATGTCASGFGVVGMATLREWTASDLAPSEGSHLKGAVVRGAGAHSPAHAHRCAQRGAADATTAADDIGFRCCYGAPNASVVPVPTWQQTFRRAELTPQAVAQMLSSIPELRELGSDISFFKEPDDVNLVLSRGDAGAQSVPNTTFTAHPVLWSPVPGEEILVVCGKAQKNAFVVALYRLPENRFRIAASFVLKDEKGPIALGYNTYVRRRLSWSLCWDCLGETGFVSYGDDNRITITQR